LSISPIISLYALVTILIYRDMSASVYYIMIIGKPLCKY